MVKVRPVAPSLTPGSPSAPCSFRPPHFQWPRGGEPRSAQTSLPGRHIVEGLLEGDFPEDILPLPVPHTHFIYRTVTLPGTQQGPEKHGLILFSTPATPPGRLPPSHRCWWQVWVFRSCAILPGPASMARPLCLSSMAWGRQGHGQGALSACPLGVLRGRCDWQLRVFSMEEILRPPRHTHHLGWLGPLNPSNENQVQIK